MTELLSWLVLLHAGLVVLFTPLQIGLYSGNQQAVNNALYFGARAASISGGEDASVDAAIAAQLSNGRMDTNNGDGTVSWGVYQDSSCSISASAGTVGYGTGLYMCLTYKQPYSLLFFPSGTFTWTRKQFIRAEAGT